VGQFLGGRGRVMVPGPPVLPPVPGVAGPQSTASRIPSAKRGGEAEGSAERSSSSGGGAAVRAGSSGGRASPGGRGQWGKERESSGRHTFVFEGDGAMSHRQFLAACEREAANQLGLLTLASEKAQKALDFGRANPKCGTSSRTSSTETATEGSGLEVFDGRLLGCTVDRYVKRMLKYADCSACNLVIGFLYLERIKREYPDLQLTPYNLQRLLLCACMVACKMFDDIYYSNRHWAELGEIEVAEMNNLELKFLGHLNFNCQVQTDEYYKFTSSLQRTSRLLSAPQDTLAPAHTAHVKQMSFSASHSSGSWSRASSRASPRGPASSSGAASPPHSYSSSIHSNTRSSLTSETRQAGRGSLSSQSEGPRLRVSSNFSDSGGVMQRSFDKKSTFDRPYLKGMSCFGLTKV